MCIRRSSRFYPGCSPAALSTTCCGVRSWTTPGSGWERSWTPKKNRNNSHKFGWQKTKSKKRCVFFRSLLFFLMSFIMFVVWAGHAARRTTTTTRRRQPHQHRRSSSTRCRARALNRRNWCLTSATATIICSTRKRRLEHAHVNAPAVITHALSPGVRQFS